MLSQKKQKQNISTSAMVLMAMCTAVLCVSAYISIPLPVPGSPHITMVNFVILLIALLFPARQAVVIVAIWMLLGIVGIPVYIGGLSGIGYLASAWGGYTVAFPVTVLVVALVRGERYERRRYTVAAVLGVIVTNFIGMCWLKYFGIEGYDRWATVFAAGFVAFLPADLVKAFVAAQIVKSFRVVLKK